MPNKLSRFWQELKRRNVHRSLAVYAGSAFIILEAATIIFPRWGFPDWTIDLVIYLLILGAIINIIVAWIFDITPQGVHKTRSLTEVRETGETNKRGDTTAWKFATYISLVVIIGLIFLNVFSRNRGDRTGTIDSLVILPFDNFTGDDQLDNIVSAMHSLLIGDIGRINGLRVISATTAKAYKEANMSASEIAQELNVSGVMEGSVMCMGNDVCTQFRLIDAAGEEKQVWMADYKVPKGQVLNLYDRITEQVAEKVKIELSPEEKQRLAESRTVDPEALDAYLKAQFHWERLNKEDLDSALKYFQIAVNLDPDWADPHSGLALTWLALGSLAYAPLADSYANAYPYLDKALELDPNSAHSHYAKAIIEVWMNWDWETGEKEFQHTLMLNPNDALARIYYAHLLMTLHRFDEAIKHANLAIIIDPLKPLVLGLYGVVMNYTGDHQAAMTQAQKALTLDPDNRFAVRALAEAYLSLGDTLKWYDIKKTTYYWTDKTYLSYLDKVFQEGGYLAVVQDRIRVNEVGYSSGRSIALRAQAERYLAVGDYDRAMDYYEKAYEEKYGFLSYISLDILKYPNLKEYPRYIALLKKMNLPLPED